MSDARIAVVDDDLEMLRLLGTVLGKAGYAVDTYPTPGRFFDGLLKAKPDLCIIDIQLPGMDGREVIRVVRGAPETARVPLIAISAAARATEDVVLGLERGASEYLSKPLDLELLVVRVANLLARASNGGPPPAEALVWRQLRVVPDEHTASLAGINVALTHLEFQLLLAFLRQPNRVLARSWLLQTVWQADSKAGTRTVDKHVETLRRKLPAFGKCIETVVRVGYLFRA